MKYLIHTFPSKYPFKKSGSVRFQYLTDETLYSADTFKFNIKYPCLLDYEPGTFDVRCMVANSVPRNQNSTK